MKHFVSLLLLTLLANTTFSQGKNDFLLSIGGKQISTEEFLTVYRKNNNNLSDESEKKSPKQYLDLFINYKLKVAEAEALKMDTSQAFISELAGYRKELAEPYLTDVTYDEKLVKETYQRLTKEINASHILILADSKASPEDTLKAYEKIVSIRNEVVNGLNFSEAALKYSEDPSVEANRGMLNYFTAFQMIAPFEDAAYSLKTGEISMPVRTSYGYHLIKIEDIRDARGELKVAHIMKTFPQNMSEAEKRRLKIQADSLYSLLKNGADFAELARANSDDKPSAQSGGELPWFHSGRMIPEFANPAFELKNNGDLSPVVESPYGYHIIKRLDHHPVKPFDEMKKEIENKIRKDPQRSLHSKEAFIAKLKKEYQFTIDQANLSQIFNKLEGPKTSDEINNGNFGEPVLPLFTAAGKTFTHAGFFEFLKNKIGSGQPLKKAEASNLFNGWVENELMAYEDSKLEEKYPEFRQLMQEYHDGILLFNLSDEKIWAYAAKDSAGLENFYAKNKGKYLWGERFKGLVITCKDQDTRDEVDKCFGAGMNYKEVAGEVNRNGERVTFEEGAWEKNANPVIDYYVWDGKKPDGLDELLVFVRGDKTGAEPKNLNEARGLYLSDYQNFLEKEWIKELRKKYTVKVNQKVLKSLDDV